MVFRMPELLCLARNIPHGLSLAPGPHLDVLRPASTPLKSPKPTSAASTTTYFLLSLAQSLPQLLPCLSASPQPHRKASLSSGPCLKLASWAQECSRKMASLQQSCLEKLLSLYRASQVALHGLALGPALGNPFGQFCHLLDCQGLAPGVLDNQRSPWVPGSWDWLRHFLHSL